MRHSVDHPGAGKIKVQQRQTTGKGILTPCQGHDRHDVSNINRSFH